MLAGAAWASHGTGGSVHRGTCSRSGAVGGYRPRGSPPVRGRRLRPRPRTNVSGSTPRGDARTARARRPVFLEMDKTSRRRADMGQRAAVKLLEASDPASRPGEPGQLYGKGSGHRVLQGSLDTSGLGMAQPCRFPTRKEVPARSPGAWAAGLPLCSSTPVAAQAILGKVRQTRDATPARGPVDGCGLRSCRHLNSHQETALHAGDDRPQGTPLHGPTGHV